MKKTLVSYSLCILFGLSACGGGDSTQIEQAPPSPGTPEDPGVIKIGYFSNGRELTLGEINSDTAPFFYSKPRVYQDLKDEVVQIPSYGLQALNGMTVGIGDSVADVHPPFETERTPYINPITNDYYTQKEFSAGVFDTRNRLISLALQSRNGAHINSGTRRKVLFHETCHAIDSHQGNLSQRQENLDRYTADIAQIRYKGNLGAVPDYYALVADGGIQTDIKRVSQEIFAEICAYYLTGNDDQRVEALFQNYSRYVFGVIRGLEEKNKNTRYAFNIVGAPGDTTVAITHNRPKTTQYADLTIR